MANLRDVHGDVFKNSSPVFMSRVVDTEGEVITLSDISGQTIDSSSSEECDLPVTYSVYLLDDQDADDRTVVTGHDGVELNAEDVIFDDLQISAAWTIDTVGFNFRHQIDGCPNGPFTIAGRRYLVEYKFQTAGGGKVIVVRFRVNVI